MGTEIERKYLLKYIPSKLIEGCTAKKIQQGYLVLGSNSELRIRMLGDKFYFTSKRGKGLVREELEQEVNQVVFNLVWPFTEGKRINKERYSVAKDGLLYEIDLYKGELEGLMVLEVEFKSVDDANAFVMPDFCERDITEDSRYKNAQLASIGLS